MQCLFLLCPIKISYTNFLIFFLSDRHRNSFELIVHLFYCREPQNYPQRWTERRHGHHKTILGKRAFYLSANKLSCKNVFITFSIFLLITLQRQFCYTHMYMKMLSISHTNTRTNCSIFPLRLNIFYFTFFFNF